jgi:hypothetical protein
MERPVRYGFFSVIERNNRIVRTELACEHSDSVVGQVCMTKRRCADRDVRIIPILAGSVMAGWCSVHCFDHSAKEVSCAHRAFSKGEEKLTVVARLSVASTNDAGKPAPTSWPQRPWNRPPGRRSARLD